MIYWNKFLICFWFLCLLNFVFLECGLNEVYSECGNNKCQNTCQATKRSQICDGPCVPGCICANGYLRNSKGVCVLIKDCGKSFLKPDRISKTCNQNIISIYTGMYNRLHQRTTKFSTYVVHRVLTLARNQISSQGSVALLVAFQAAFANQISWETQTATACQRANAVNYLNFSPPNFKL